MAEKTRVFESMKRKLAILKGKLEGLYFLTSASRNTHDIEFIHAELLEAIRSLRDILYEMEKQ